MRETLELLRYERRARIFFVALAQSALGNGAGYVALLLIAYDRFESPWAISLVLIADLLPAMLLGPVFGALADRWSRNWCMVLADVLRVGAFAGVALVDSFSATILFAALAGVGTGLFTPAALASLPSVVDERRRTPAATSLYGIVGDLGFTAGPAIGAALLALGGAETIMVANAVTFAVSAALLAALPFGDAPARGDGVHRSLLSETREGLRATVGMRDIRIVLLGSAGGLVCAGLFNVAELFFVTDDLGASDIDFSILVTFFGVGFVGGSLVGSKGGEKPLLKRRYLTGLLALGASLLLTGVASTLAVAALTFAFAGFGNGLLLVYERLLIQAAVPDRLVGRIFGVKDALTAWAFGIAFLAGGGLVAALGARELILVAGATALLVYAASAVALRSEWLTDDAPGEAEGGEETTRLDRGAHAVSGGEGVLGEDGANVVRGGEGLGLESLDDAR
jgi:MFS family permease